MQIVPTLKNEMIPQSQPRSLSSLAALILFFGIMVLARASEADHVYSDPAHGYTLRYPTNWIADDTALARGGPLVLQNFPVSTYLPGGLTPGGGAAITVRYFPPWEDGFSPTTDEYAKLDQEAAYADPYDLTRVDRSHGPARVAFTSGSPPSRTIYTAARKGGRLFFLILDYQVGEPDGPRYERILSGILKSITVQKSQP
jgi:hypothetical protein